MSEHMFGVHRGRLSDEECARREAVAKRHGAWFTQIKDPGSGWISWFSCRNRGEPFDRETARAVLAEVQS